MFAAIDKHPDGDLNTAELSRLVRVLIHLGFAVQDEPPAAEDLAAWTAASLFMAPLAATGLISSYDYDGDDSLSFDEIAGELAGAGILAPGAEHQASARDRAREALEQAQRSLRGLTRLLGVLR